MNEFEKLEAELKELRPLPPSEEFTSSLEIALFRIIQELTTNIIKHAQANHATINISLDEEDITVLIEDNGIGMNASQIDLKKGMGLHSIKTRVEHLEGSFTIDSTPGKGTTIIMNIPT